MDTDGTFMITIDEFRKALKEVEGIDIEDEEIDRIISELSYKQKINYSEFIAATLDVKTFLTEEKLKHVFSKFDR